MPEWTDPVYDVVDAMTSAALVLVAAGAAAAAEAAATDTAHVQTPAMTHAARPPIYSLNLSVRVRATPAGPLKRCRPAPSGRSHRRAFYRQRLARDGRPARQADMQLRLRTDARV